MIIRCPSCTTRFELPASRFDADGTMIKCSVCGHDWIEGRAIEISRDIESKLPALIEPAFEPDHEIKRLVEATRDAQETFTLRRKQRHARVGAWLALVLATGMPAAFATAFPEITVAAVPASISLYNGIGRSVNIYGLEIRQVETQHLLIDGKRIIAVKGEITNVSASARKMPWLRFTLKGPGNAEVYSWNLETTVRPLNPGESTNFVTRISSPPETARNLEIRFAQATEIGSNAAHE